MARQARPFRIALATFAFSAQGVALRAHALSRAGLQRTPAHS
jgi:hypothetical protein